MLMMPWRALAARESSAGPGKPEKRQPADADDAGLGGPWQLEKRSAGPGKPERRQPADADDARLGGPWQLAKAARDLGSLKKTTADADDARLGEPCQLAKAARDLGSLKKDNRLVLTMLALAARESSAGPGKPEKRQPADADDARLGGPCSS